MMKKMIVALAAMTFAFGSQADPGVFEKTVAIGAVPQVVYTNFVTLGEDTYKYVEKITFFNGTSATISSVTATEDVGVWTTIDTSSATTGAGSTPVYPIRASVSGTITNIAQYAAKKLRIISTLNATNSTATATGLKISIYAK